MDENLRQISAALDVTVFRRGEKFIVSGENALRAVELLEEFYEKADKNISVEDIQLALVEQRAQHSAPQGNGQANGAAGDDRPEGLDEAGPVLKTRRNDLR